MNHDGVATAEEEGRQDRIEHVSPGELHLHRRFLALAHGDGGPIVPGAAEEGGMVLLEELVAVVPREETGGLASKTGEARDAEAAEREGKRARRGDPEARGSFPGRDTGNRGDGSVDLGVKLQEGGQVGVELRNASEVTDTSGYALADKWESGPAGQA